MSDGPSFDSTLDRIMAERLGQGRDAPRRRPRSVPNDFRPSHTVAAIRARYEPTKPPPPAADAPKEKGAPIAPVDGEVVRLAGRLVAKRGFGKTVFAPIRDGGADLQLYLAIDHRDAADFAQVVPELDVGDIVGAEGAVFWTKRGELSLLVTKVVLLTKALRPLPDKWHGLTDVEARYRQRYVDLADQPRGPRGVR